MRLTLLFLFLISLAPASQAVAGAAEDVRFITQHVLRDVMKKTVPDMVAGAYTHHYIDWLRERSARLEDAGRFAELLPPEATQVWVARFPGVVETQCFKTFSPKELRLAAEDIRRNPKGAVKKKSEKTRRAIDPADPVSGLEAVNRDLAALNREMEEMATALRTDPRMRVEMAGGACAFRTLLNYSWAIAQSPKIEADISVKGLSEILQTPGIATFPNRIVRQSILREVAAAQKR
ncbi:hypothetical protein [Rhodalgimonas zhirmunskyi]|uniref:Uncharacterized protein n=1 Tax=Rhodalgimonas zhirmunskyi TaxID=2964767 RepID=A0AAJ1X3M1_9RHOB|nr:hypothetical protein [Rhodoalgimonas zhirmunskyi]MDQ2092646.1 hypothetical protein [Rhodoalgimonas zhirmunskyi]